jgi:sulfite exporter TauE/SafE
MLSTETLYLLYLSTGFTVGFGHCIGMCGPLVASFSLNLKEKSILVPQLLYHLGRITTYAILGGVVAAAGAFTMVAAHIERVQKGVMVFAGTLIVLMEIKSTIVYLPLGLLLGLLPCGPVYTALLGAARTGMEAPAIYHGVFAGMGLMTAFGLGTVPALFLVAKLADMGWLKSRDIIYKVGAVLIILVGIFFIIKAIRY